MLLIFRAGMVCAFVTNELIRQQTSDAEDAVVPTLVASLEDLETFKEDIFDVCTNAKSINACFKYLT